MKINKLFLFLIFPLCLLSCSSNIDDAAEKNSDTTITFNKDVAKIIFTNCSPCHHKGGAGPFPLTSYDEVRKKASTIVKVTQSRFMPPWPADVSYSHFVGEKYLSHKEIAMLKSWTDKGCPVGDTTNAENQPLFNSESVFGKPDAVVKMKELFSIKGNNKDVFMLMKFPFEIERDTFIKMIEFVPGNKKLVHHVNGFLIKYDYAKKKNIYDGAWFVNTEDYTYQEAFTQMKLANDDGKTFPSLTPSAVNYLPGVQPQLYPEGIGGFSVNKKSVIFLKDIHYGPSAIDTTDDSHFNIYFSPKKPERPLLEFQLGTLGQAPVVPTLQIQPDSVKEFYTQIIVPFDISIITINPHMHLLGKTYWAFVIKPDGDTIPLININKWDFRWQYFYTFKNPIHVPKGSLIKAIGVFDNTSKNPLNPFSPPRLVGERNGSMKTTDEMFQFIVNYLPYKPGDENINMQTNQTKK
jgi:hypothetical protein